LSSRGVGFISTHSKKEQGKEALRKGIVFGVSGLSREENRHNQQEKKPKTKEPRENQKEDAKFF